MGMRMASATICSSEPSKSADDAGGDERRAHVGEQPGEAASLGVEDRVGELFVRLHAAELLDVGIGLFLEHVDDVVDHDDADEPAGLVHHGGRDEVVALEQARHLLLVLGRLDPVGLVVHDLLDGDRALGAQEPVEGTAPSRWAAGSMTKIS